MLDERPLRAREAFDEDVFFRACDGSCLEPAPALVAIQYCEIVRAPQSPAPSPTRAQLITVLFQARARCRSPWLDPRGKIMDFHEFPRFLGEIWEVSRPPRKVMCEPILNPFRSER